MTRDEGFRRLAMALDGKNMGGYTYNQLKIFVREGKPVGSITLQDFKDELAKREAKGPDTRKTMKNFKGEEVPNPMYGKYS